LIDDGGASVWIWTLPLHDADETDAARWRGRLSAEEQARSDHFVFASDRLAYLGAHALARRMLAEHLDCPPEGLRFVAEANGKPRAWVGDDVAAVWFNLSHTRGMVAVAISSTVEPGVDVEALRRTMDLAVAESVLAPAEQRWLFGLPPDEQAVSFVRLWTLKEAYVKATGHGLSQALDAFWFAPDAWRIQFSPAIADDPLAWRFHQQVLGEQFVLSAAWREAPTCAAVLTMRGMTPREF
jgi:4'-phosphopantetheinyl transferase